MATSKIVCDLCNKEFAYDCLLLKHLSRKFPCYSNKPSEKATLSDNRLTIQNQAEIIKSQGLTIKHQASIIDDRSVKKYSCDICSKRFCNKKECENHADKCSGCHILQCSTCKKEFKNANAKYYHKKYVDCEPIQQEPTYPPGCNIDNSITNNITHNTTNNFMLNWSDEQYAHVTSKEIANLITKKCQDHPVQFFTEFPRLAHRERHANVKCTNLRGQHMDVYEDGKFSKVSSMPILDEATRRMCHRVDDAYNEDEQAFKRCRPTTEAIINMEDVINDSGDKQKSIHYTKVMGLERRTARTEIMAATKAGLYTS